MATALPVALNPIPEEDIGESQAWREWFYQLSSKVAAMKMLTVPTSKTKTAISTQEYTVAKLPTTVTKGTRCYVTDATAPTFLGALTGGGTVVCPVFFNGTAWVAG